MFGYVRPRKDELRLKDYDAYRAAYCGLCRAMGKRYGFLTRFLVNYDMTFLYLLRRSTEEGCPVRRCFCPARLFRRKDCICDDAGYEVVAACNVILTYHKLQDDAEDAGFFRRLVSRAAMRLLRRPYHRAAERLPAFRELARRQLEALRALEQARCPSIDETADAFALLIAGCASDLTDPAIRRPMEQVLYHTGRFLYLADALDDLSEDCRKGRYNPLRCRFSVENGKLSEQDLDYLAQLTDASVNLAGSALALLPDKAYGPVLENIVYLGLPSVFFAVRQGRFRARDRF